ncbi:MAG: hypothetical protein EXR08_02355 [Alphaproteobacteria bacterium]|nr:hypothetical protein [Alphaproteobacteria bacterium]
MQEHYQMQEITGKSGKRLGALTAGDLRRGCDISSLGFASTGELAAPEHVFGQERAINAIEFGADMDREGFNLFVMGDPGSGKRSLVRQLLQQRAATRPVPGDWVYVYNFAEPHKPNAIELPAARGCAFATPCRKWLTSCARRFPPFLKVRNIVSAGTRWMK